MQPKSMFFNSHLSVFLSLIGSEPVTKSFIFCWMFRNKILSVFPLRKMFWNGIPSYWSSEQWFGTKWWISGCFPLLWNGSERIIAFYCLRNGILSDFRPKADVIPMEWIKKSICSMFRGINLFLENDNLIVPMHIFSDSSTSKPSFEAAKGCCWSKLDVTTEKKHNFGRTRWCAICVNILVVFVILEK